MKPIVAANCVCYLWCVIWYFRMNVILLQQRIMPTNFLMTVICCPLSCFWDFTRWSLIWLYRSIKFIYCFFFHYMPALFNIFHHALWWLDFKPRITAWKAHLDMPCVDACLCMYFCVFVHMSGNNKGSRH